MHLDILSPVVYPLPSKVIVMLLLQGKDYDDDDGYGDDGYDDGGGGDEPVF